MSGIVALASPRRRRSAAVCCPEEDTFKEPGKRSRISARVLAFAMACAVLLSMATFNGSRGGTKAGRLLKGHQAARQLTEQQERRTLGVTGGKRHRKLEHGAHPVTVGRESGTLATVVDDDGGGGRVGGSHSQSQVSRVVLPHEQAGSLVVLASSSRTSSGGKREGMVMVARLQDVQQGEGEEEEGGAAVQQQRHRHRHHGSSSKHSGVEAVAAADGDAAEREAAAEQQQQEQQQLDTDASGFEGGASADAFGGSGDDNGGDDNGDAADGGDDNGDAADGGDDADLAAVLQQQEAEERQEELRQAALGGSDEDDENEDGVFDSGTDGGEDGGDGVQTGLDDDDVEDAAATDAGSEDGGQDAGSESGEDAGSEDSSTSADGAVAEAGSGSDGGSDGGALSAAAAEGAASSGGKPQQRRKKSAYHRALQKCDSLACVREAAKKPRHPGQFLFPHFLILGWQKCATTSLFKHLIMHPKVQCPSQKEPEFFSYDCGYNAHTCPASKEKEYVTETLHIERALRHNLYRASFEGSTHYAREGQKLAKSLYETFPWVKLIASMREPISRGISMLAHNLDKSSIGCLTKRDVYLCLERDLGGMNYSEPFSSWLEAYPREQIMLLQYESLTAPDKAPDHLRNVKTFLGIDPELPDNELEQHNTREQRLGAKPEGWPMQRWQYDRLIQIVRPDAEKIADIVTANGFGDGRQWMHNWEAAWQANLNSCDLEGNCIVQLT